MMLTEAVKIRTFIPQKKYKFKKKAINERDIFKESLEIFLEEVDFSDADSIWNDGILGGRIPLGLKKEDIERIKKNLSGDLTRKSINGCINDLKNLLQQSEIKFLIIFLLKYAVKTMNNAVGFNRHVYSTMEYADRNKDAFATYVQYRKRPRTPEIEELFKKFEENPKKAIDAGFEHTVQSFYDKNDPENTKKEYNVEYIYPSKKPGPDYKGWEIYIPKDFEAARNTSWLLDNEGHRTDKASWCTAANKGYYDSYTSKAPLYIFRNNSKKAMMQFNGTKAINNKNKENFEEVHFLDFKDSELRVPKGFEDVLKTVPKEALEKVFGAEIAKRFRGRAYKKDDGNPRQEKNTKIPGRLTYSFSNDRELNLIGEKIKEKTGINVGPIINMFSGGSYDLDNENEEHFSDVAAKNSKIKRTLQGTKKEFIGKISFEDNGNKTYRITFFRGGKSNTVDFEVDKDGIGVDVIDTKAKNKNNNQYTSNKRKEAILAKQNLQKDREEDARGHTEYYYRYTSNDTVSFDFSRVFDDNEKRIRELYLRPEHMGNTASIVYIDKKDKEQKKEHFSLNELRAKFPKTWRLITADKVVSQWLRDNKLRAAVEVIKKNIKR